MAASVEDLRFTLGDKTLPYKYPTDYLERKLDAAAESMGTEDLSTETARGKELQVLIAALSVKMAKLGDDAGAMGAALWGAKKIFKSNMPAL